MHLHNSEKTGRGIPTIVNKYGKESIKVSENNIIVTFLFNRINEVGDKAGDKSKNNDLSISQIKVLAEIRNNPNITKPQLMIKCEVGKTSIDNIIRILKDKGYIKRIDGTVEIIIAYIYILSTGYIMKAWQNKKATNGVKKLKNEVTALH